MNETHDVWMGYLVSETPAFTVVQSPFLVGGQRVFGADSDATTMAVAALLHRARSDQIEQVSVPSGVDEVALAVSCNVSTPSEEELETCTWDIMIGEEAIVVLARRDAEVVIPNLDVAVDGDAELHASIDAAWEHELNAQHVSQGAFVSEAMYAEGASARLAMMGQQNSDGVVWPPRFGPADTQQHITRSVSPLGTVLSWTQLSAAGAPSEFSLRAPLLGGLKTVLLELDDGPRGVFLLVDDEEHDVNIGDRVALVLRRLYAQEGFMRYGLKGRLV